MLNGRCPRCGSNEIYRSTNGITGKEKGVFVKTGFMNPATNKVTYLCTGCGYWEDYLPNREVLDKVKTSKRWEKV